MKAVHLAVLFALALPVCAGAGTVFDPTTTSPEQSQPDPDTHSGATTSPVYIPPQAANSGFVTNGSQATITRALEQTVALIQQHVDQAASDGDTALRDALIKDLQTYQTLLDKAKTQAIHPSLYPLELGKKGCLFAIRKTRNRVGPADRPTSVEFQLVSWMKVKITGRRDDGSLDAEIYDNSNRFLLYKACLHGITSDALKPGVTAQLVNMRFEITSQEDSDSGGIYHLKRLPPAPANP